MNLRLRLALWYGALLSIVLFAALAGAYFTHADAHISDMDQLLQATTDEILGTIAPDIQAGRIPTTISTPEDSHLPTMGAVVFDGERRIVTSGGRVDLSALDPGLLDLGDAFITVKLPAERVRVLLMAIPNTTYHVAVATSLAELDASLAGLRSQLLMLGLAGIAVALSGGWVIAEGALRPIAAVTETASEIRQSGRFVQRVRGPRREDEVGELARTFNAMLDTLENAYEKQQSFVSDASHELRTPLTVVRANVELLAKSRDSAERDQLVTHVAREVERLCRLVDDLLVLSRADAGAEAFRPAPVQLDEVLMEAFEELRGVGTERLRIVDLADVRVVGERDRLKQLAVILLDNALRYTPPPRTVSASVAAEADEGVLVVEDEGIGVRQDELPRIFDRFYRGERARRVDPTGSGLGLSIARWIVERHHGSIEIRPRERIGTRVVVRLPLFQRPSPETPLARTATAI